MFWLLTIWHWIYLPGLFNLASANKTEGVKMSEELCVLYGFPHTTGKVYTLVTRDKPLLGTKWTSSSLTLRPHWPKNSFTIAKFGQIREPLDQKAGEDGIEWGGYVPGSSSSRTWQLQPHGSGFRVKERRKSLWKKFIPQLKKATEIQYATAVSLHEGLEGLLHEAVKMKSELSWRPQNVRDARTVGIPA